MSSKGSVESFSNYGTGFLHFEEWIRMAMDDLPVRPLATKDGGNSQVHRGASLNSGKLSLFVFEINTACEFGRDDKRDVFGVSIAAPESRRRPHQPLLHLLVPPMLIAAEPAKDCYVARVRVDIL